MAVGQAVPALPELAEQSGVRIALRKGEVLLIVRQLIELRPYLQHSGFLSGVYCVGIGFSSAPGPADIPVGEMRQDIQRQGVSGVDVRIGKSHDGLVHNVLRRPDVLVVYQACEVLLGNGAYPLAAVKLLAACKFADYTVHLYFQLSIAVGGDKLCRSAYPVPQEVSAQLAHGSLPAPVDIRGGGIVNDLESREDYSSLQVEILEQAVSVKLHQIAAVYVHSLAEYAGEYLYRAVLYVVQHDDYLAEVIYFGDIIVAYPVRNFSRQNPIFVSQNQDSIFPHTAFRAQKPGPPTRRSRQIVQWTKMQTRQSIYSDGYFSATLSLNSRIASSLVNVPSI